MSDTNTEKTIAFVDAIHKIKAQWPSAQTKIKYMSTPIEPYLEITLGSYEEDFSIANSHRDLRIIIYINSDLEYTINDTNVFSRDVLEQIENFYKREYANISKRLSCISSILEKN